MRRIFVGGVGLVGCHVSVCALVLRLNSWLLGCHAALQRSSLLFVKRLTMSWSVFGIFSVLSRLPHQKLGRMLKTRTRLNAVWTQRQGSCEGFGMSQKPRTTLGGISKVHFSKILFIQIRNSAAAGRVGKVCFDNSPLELLSRWFSTAHTLPSLDA